MQPHGEDDGEGLLGEYDVYITPELAQQIFLLQYPTRRRDAQYSAKTNSQPIEVRIKPTSGFMELDIGVELEKTFDRGKGVVWGEALRMTKASGTDAFGIASGFGKANKANESLTAERTLHAAEESERLERLLEDFEKSTREGRVLNKQTLGGQIIRSQPGGPIYMLGTFRKNELHLSPLSGVVQLRPQFHHIDARSQLSKAKKASEKANTDSRALESRLITQRAHTGDDEELNVEQTDNFMRQAAGEHWLRLAFHDEDTDEAYAAFRSSLFVRDGNSASQLISPWNNDEFLDAISIPRIEPGNKAKKKPPLTRKEMADIQHEAQAEHHVHVDDESGQA